MKLNTLSSILIGASIVLVQPQIVRALSVEQIEQTAREIIVQIVDTQNSTNSGSGVIIKQTGNTYTVITAKHVVEQGQKNLITPSKQTYQIKNIKQLQGLDLVILEFNSNQKYTIAKIGDSDKIDKTSLVYVAGFPAKTAAAPNVDFRVKDGKVDAKGNQRDGYDLSYDNRTSRGMSGGAVLNSQGELIGIHGRAITEASEDDPKQVVISGALGTSIYSALRSMLASGVDVGVRPPQVIAAAPSADDFYLKANDKYYQQDYKRAIASYTEAIRLNPKYVQAYTNRGEARYRLGDKQGAISDFNSALKINPNDALAYNNRGFVRDQLGDKQGAIVDYNLAIKFNPNYVLAYNNRGEARYKLGDKQGAISDFNSALKINPNDALAYNNRGFVRDQLGDKQGAIVDYNLAIKFNPNYVLAYNNRGEARYKLGDKQGAISDFNSALKINPNDALAYNNRGFVRDQLGDKQGAIVDYNFAIKFNPNYALAYGNRGIARYELGDKPGAISDLRKAAELSRQQGNTADYQKALQLIKKYQQ